MDKAAYAADVLTFACRHVLGEKGSGMQGHAWEVQQLKEELAQRSASRPLCQLPLEPVHFLGMLHTTDFLPRHITHIKTPQ